MPIISNFPGGGPTIPDNISLFVVNESEYSALKVYTVEDSGSTVMQLVYEGESANIIVKAHTVIILENATFVSPSGSATVLHLNDTTKALSIDAMVNLATGTAALSTH